MQSYRSLTGTWTPMEDGAAATVWHPRVAAVGRGDAAAKCLAWKGFLGVPATQVIDLAPNDVVWRLGDRYPAAGEPIALRPADEQVAHELARAALGNNPTCPPKDADGAQLELPVRIP